jgi:hypothetical protein
MGSEFTFYDYVDADNGGANIISNWLNGEGKPVKAHFHSMISRLEVSPPGGSQESVWQPPFVKPLHKPWQGFVEIRKKVGNIQYRLIAKKENRNVYIVTWGFHKWRGLGNPYNSPNGPGKGPPDDS